MLQLSGGLVLILIITFAVLSFALIKKENSYGYIMLYLFTWLIFGCIYWGLATFSKNDNFIFEEHIKLNSMAKIINKKLNNLYNVEDIKNILISDSHDIQALNLNAGNNRDIAFTDRNIGIEWAALYMNYYKNRGYTHYAFKLLKAEKDPKELQYFKPIEEIIFAGETSQATILYKYQVTLYRVTEDSEKETFMTIDSANQMEAKETIFVWTTKRFNTLTQNNEEIYFTPVKYGLHSILAFSFSMPDQSIWSFKEVELGEVPYPIVDFMYFSAVTLTTLGYGDILPNSSLTRASVMIETLLGLILIGIFISKVLEKKRTD